MSSSRSCRPHCKVVPSPAMVSTVCPVSTEEGQTPGLCRRWCRGTRPGYGQGEEGEAPRCRPAILGSQWPGRGSRASVMLTVAWRGANVMFVGRPRDGSEGREGGLGIRRGQFAGEGELAEIRCHDGDGGGERAVCGEDGRSRGLIVWRAAVGGIRNSQEEGM